MLSVTDLGTATEHMHIHSYRTASHATNLLGGFYLFSFAAFAASNKLPLPKSPLEQDASNTCCQLSVLGYRQQHCSGVIDYAGGDARFLAQRTNSHLMAWIEETRWRRLGGPDAVYGSLETLEILEP